MKHRARALAAGLGLAAALVVALLLTSGSPAPAVAPFSLPALGGGSPVQVPVLHDGRQLPVVLTFFASWCGPCHGELPRVAQEAGRLAAAGTRVAFIGVDGNDDPASGLAFARSSGVTFPVGTDAGSVVAPRFGLPGYPATVFIDAGGNVVHVVRGPVSPAVLHDWATRIALRR